MFRIIAISIICNTTIIVLKFVTDFRLRRLKAVIKVISVIINIYDGMEGIRVLK